MKIKVFVGTPSIVEHELNSFISNNPDIFIYDIEITAKINQIVVLLRYDIEGTYRLSPDEIKTQAEKVLRDVFKEELTEYSDWLDEMEDDRQQLWVKYNELKQKHKDDN
jgi:hypothetical protein